MVGLQVWEKNFAKADADVKVFGQRVVTKFTKGFYLAQAQILEFADRSSLDGFAKTSFDPS